MTLLKAAIAGAMFATSVISKAFGPAIIRSVRYSVTPIAKYGMGSLLIGSQAAIVYRIPCIHPSTISQNKTNTTQNPIEYIPAWQPNMQSSLQKMCGLCGFPKLRVPFGRSPLPFEDA